MSKKSTLQVAGLAAVCAASVGAIATTVLLVKKRRAKRAQAPKDTYVRAEQAEQASPDYYQAVKNAYDGGPNANPVSSPKPETPRTADGKIDVTKLASPEDFCNWEEHGCQG